jgi:cyclophilin family peptidyl-prolyl cis-trans isomerase
VRELPSTQYSIKTINQIRRDLCRPIFGLLLTAAGLGSAQATEVAVTTPLGEIRVELYEDKPVTVGNFLAYVNAGRFTDSFAHRLMPGFVLQGGGFTLSPNITPIDVPIFGPIVNEYGAGQTRSNVLGTIAMAKLGGNPDSATSQWFFNLGNNSANLDSQNGGFTVFGHVVAGLDVLTLFNTTFNQQATGGRGVYDYGGVFETLPLGAGSLAINNFVHTTWSIVTATAYWQGGMGTQWNQPANFATSRTANYSATSPVNATTDVVFNADGAANFANTTLGANQSIRSLMLRATSAVGIGGGHTLTITPDATTAGITVTAAAPGALTHVISSGVVLGATQTWTVAADRTLVVDGNVSGNFALTKAGNGVLNLNGTQAYATLTAAAGTTNVNGAFVPPVGTASVAVSAGARLKFGSVSQTLGALTIGPGATVAFTSGAAVGAFSGSGKDGVVGGSAAVPEPGTAGLLLLGGLGLLSRRRRGRNSG